MPPLLRETLRTCINTEADLMLQYSLRALKINMRDATVIDFDGTIIV